MPRRDVQLQGWPGASFGLSPQPARGGAGVMTQNEVDLFLSITVACSGLFILAVIVGALILVYLSTPEFPNDDGESM
jgi:hypothetical protein